MSDSENIERIESNVDGSDSITRETTEADGVDNQNGGLNEFSNQEGSFQQHQTDQEQNIHHNDHLDTNFQENSQTGVNCSKENSHEDSQPADQSTRQNSDSNVETNNAPEGLMETFQDPEELFPEDRIQAVKESCEKARQLLSESTNPVVQEALKQPLNGSLASKHDDDERKIFVGGLHWETTMNDLRDYFSQFGKVIDSTLKTDPSTGRSRGFGFVLFEDIEAVNKVCEEKQHVLQGKTIDPKRAVSKSNAIAAGKQDPVKKIFVGGVSPDMSEGDIRSFFVKYGKIEEVELPFDRMKNQRRAYVFITYNNESCAEEACKQPKQKLGERDVDVRRATPRSENEASRGGRGRGRGGYDYTAYYGYPGYSGYPGYQMPAYDYSNYYGNDWSQYNQQYAQQYGYQMGQTAAGATPAASQATSGGTTAAANPYASYDYNSWYNQQDPGKMKRGTTAPAYHPYSR